MQVLQAGVENQISSNSLQIVGQDRSRNLLVENGFGTEADLEEMKAAKSEADHEKIKGMAKHCNYTPRLKATPMLTPYMVGLPLL
jgi:hypothetical protein